MGIPSLLEQLKSVTRRSHVSEFRNQRVAVDAHCWLHRGSYSCSKDLANGVTTEKYISFFIRMIHVLQQNGVKDILIVFDGLPLPGKKNTSNERHENRRRNLNLARQAEQQGDLKSAQSYYQRSINITADMVHRLCEILEKEKILYLISPYEADAQLAFLSNHGMIDIVITEDSDAIVYGCHQIFFKMDKDGNGDLLQRCHLGSNDTLSFANWSDDQFTLFCCLAGCDYMPKIKDIGIKTAYKIVSKHKTLPRVISHLMLTSSGAGSEFDGAAAERLEQAMNIFKHQTIYNAQRKQCEPLTPLSNYTNITTSVYGGDIHACTSSVGGSAIRGSARRHSDTRNCTSTTMTDSSGVVAVDEQQQQHEQRWEYLGPLLDPETTRLLVRGKLNPNTMQLYSLPTRTLDSCAKLGPAGNVAIAAQQPPDGATTYDEACQLHLCYTSTGNNTENVTQASSSGRRSSSQPMHADSNKCGVITGAPMVNWIRDEDRAATAIGSSGTYSDTPVDTINTSRILMNRQEHDSLSKYAVSLANSTASASNISDQFQSSLVSSSLVPLHRRTSRIRDRHASYPCLLKAATKLVNNNEADGEDEENCEGCEVYEAGINSFFDEVDTANAYSAYVDCEDEALAENTINDAIVYENGSMGLARFQDSYLDDCSQSDMSLLQYHLMLSSMHPTISVPHIELQGQQQDRQQQQQQQKSFLPKDLLPETASTNHQQYAHQHQVPLFQATRGLPSFQDTSAETYTNDLPHTPGRLPISSVQSQATTAGAACSYTHGTYPTDRNAGYAYASDAKPYLHVLPAVAADNLLVEDLYLMEQQYAKKRRLFPGLQQTYGR